MKTNESYWHKCVTALLRHGRNAWRFFAKHVFRRTIDEDVAPNDTPGEPPDTGMSPLNRIKDHLSRHGLALRVHVRFDEASNDFVLEDDDGLVHVRHYEAAVEIINRMWL